MLDVIFETRQNLLMTQQTSQKQRVTTQLNASREPEGKLTQMVVIIEIKERGWTRFLN
tara:strand:+ start:992 stop:1165 length:174 start_codon:yes stop_codon:yes gene_type:complete